MTNQLLDIIDRRHVIVCCGTGGVGKTTVSSAIGLAAAMRGRKTCIVTIDPARRLADALGIEQVGDEPMRIPTTFPGELYAVMFNAEHTFDDLVRRNAESEEQAERILSNRLYRNLTSGLSGTQEYMATEKLYELHESGDYDCIVVDTPPTRAALDFLDAPDRVTSFIDNRMFRSLISGNSGYGRVVNIAAQALLKTIARVAGSEIVEDSLAFFQAFSGMEDGFKERAVAVKLLLDSTTTGYVLITTPRREAIDETAAFIERLKRSNHDIDALIANRVHPDFGRPLPIPDNLPSSNAWRELVTNLSDLAVLAQREEQLLENLTGPTSKIPTTRLPILPTDVHDLDALTGLARHLLDDEVPFPRGQNSHS